MNTASLQAFVLVLAHQNVLHLVLLNGILPSSGVVKIAEDKLKRLLEKKCGTTDHSGSQHEVWTILTSISSADNSGCQRRINSTYRVLSEALSVE